MAVSVRKPVLYAFGVVLCAGIIGGIWLWYRTHCVLITNDSRIEETRIGQIRVGQDVAFTIDGYPGRTFSGRIYEINPAACSVFSLISTENVAGYFTKIMQRVPVKISLPRLDSPETDPGEPEVVFRIGMQGTIEIQL